MILKKSFKLIVILYVVQDISTGTNGDYRGEDFPTKYLDVDGVTPTVEDFNYYMESLRRSVFYVLQNPNDTDINQALGFFYTKSLLKRTLLEFGGKLQKKQHELMTILVKILDFLTSHYVYKNVQYGWSDLEYRVSRIFTDDSSQVYSISDLNRNHLKKWIFSSGNLHEFVQDMDKAILPKEKYAELVESRLTYYIRIPDSDTCLSRVVNNHEPIHLSKLRPCRPDFFCRKALRSSPSVAYTLSHRLLNIMIYRQVRRCYMDTEASDDELMEMLCANMYREAVYLARRGYFARDLFLEHIALCGMLGHEEFFRRNWFHKAASWIDEDGCLHEFKNFELNRTAVMIHRATAANDRRRLKKIRKMRTRIISDDCHTHPMALAHIVLAHGIRHAIHYMPEVVSDI